MAIRNDDRQDGMIDRLREWMNTGGGRTTCIIVALAVIALTIGWIVHKWNADSSEVQAVKDRGINALYYCRECKQTGELHLSYEAKWPQVCPHCQKPSAVIGFRCLKCRQIIEKRDEVVYRCPRPGCGYVYDKRLMSGGPLPAEAGGPSLPGTGK